MEHLDVTIPHVLPVQRLQHHLSFLRAVDGDHRNAHRLSVGLVVETYSLLALHNLIRNIVLGHPRQDFLLVGFEGQATQPDQGRGLRDVQLSLRLRLRLLTRHRDLMVQQQLLEDVALLRCRLAWRFRHPGHRPRSWVHHEVAEHGKACSCRLGGPRHAWIGPAKGHEALHWILTASPVGIREHWRTGPERCRRGNAPSLPTLGQRRLRWSCRSVGGQASAAIAAIATDAEVQITEDVMAMRVLQGGRAPVAWCAHKVAAARCIIGAGKGCLGALRSWHSHHVIDLWCRREASQIADVATNWARAVTAAASAQVAAIAAQGRHG
mmetsp:Transcript_33290/g.79826  ORF Transcript_33290/g.79826 Transcript_33290/m.79826 type:complete len:324 (-) Transcript_33290:1273-2244(-)